MDSLQKAFIWLKALGEFLYQDDIDDAKKMKIDKPHHWHAKPLIENLEKAFYFLKVFK